MNDVDTTDAPIGPRAWGHAAVWAAVVGVGVLTAPVVGFGLVLVGVGASHLLARLMGQPVRAVSGVLFAGLALGVMLASLGAWVVARELGLPTHLTAAAAAGLGGALLSPLAYAPIRAARGNPDGAGVLLGAIDDAGRDRVEVVALICAVGCALLASCFPVMTAAGAQLLGGDLGAVGPGAAALSIWLVGLPALLRVLAARHRRLQSEPPTFRASPIGVPVVGAAALGTCILAMALAAMTLPPRHARVGDATDPLSGVELSHDLRVGELTLSRRLGRIRVDGRSRHELIPEHDLEVAPCAAETRVGIVTLACDTSAGRWEVALDADGAPIARPLGERLRDAVGSVTLVSASAALGILLVSLLGVVAVRWRLRRRLRPRFATEGEVTHDTDGLVFAAADGTQRVRVPARRARGPIALGGPALLCADAPLAPMTFRDALAPLPTGAQLIMGTMEDEAARCAGWARRLGFRGATVALGLLVFAALGVLAGWP